jgi:hypothetical protein
MMEWDKKLRYPTTGLAGTYENINGGKYDKKY